MKNKIANEACVTNCIVGVKKSARNIAKTIVDTSIMSIGVRMWLAFSSLNIKEIINVATPCARKAGPNLKPLMMSQMA